MINMDFNKESILNKTKSRTIDKTRVKKSNVHKAQSINIKKSNLLNKTSKTVPQKNRVNEDEKWKLLFRNLNEKKRNNINKTNGGPNCKKNIKTLKVRSNVSNEISENVLKNIKTTKSKAVERKTMMTASTLSNKVPILDKSNKKTIENGWIVEDLKTEMDNCKDNYKNSNNWDECSNSEDESYSKKSQEMFKIVTGATLATSTGETENYAKGEVNPIDSSSGRILDIIPIKTAQPTIKYYKQNENTISQSAVEFSESTDEESDDVDFWMNTDRDSDSSTSFDSSDFDSEDESDYDYSSNESEFSNDFSDFGSENDTDYEPPDDYAPSVYISRGEAKIYDIMDKNISFNSEDGPQIFEITDSVVNQTDDDSCPELVPIYENIDNTEQPKSKPKESKIEKSVNAKISVPKIFADKNEHSDSEEGHTSLLEHIFQHSSTKLENIGKNPSKSTLYDSTVSPNLVLVHLKEKIYFNGRFTITLLSGKIESAGYDFELNKPRELYSPSSSSLLYITPVQSKIKNNMNLFTDLESLFLKNHLSEIDGSYSGINEAIILLERIDNNRISVIQDYMKENIFPLHSSKKANPFISSEIRLGTRFYFAPFDVICKFEIQPNWEKIDLNANSKMIVVGGKNVGKSSFIKYLVNKTIAKSKVLFIDFDVGQPEIFLPQTISATLIDIPLLGSGFFYKLVPAKSYLFGDISVISEQIKYIKCCFSLIDYCKHNTEYNNIPWVINTMGYNKGLGEEIIVGYIKQIHITDLVQIQSPRMADNYNQIFTKEYIHSFKFNIFTLEINNLNQQETNINFKTIVCDAYANMYSKTMCGLSPKDKRHMMILAHLGDVLDNGDQLHDIQVKESFLHNMHIITSDNINKFKVSNENLLNAIDSNMVYLCHIKDPIDLSKVICLGLGIVRGIDSAENKIYLLTGLSDELLEKVNGLSLTHIQLPKSIIENQNMFSNEYIPFLGKTNNFVGSRHVVQQTYRPDTTINTRSNYVNKKI